MEILSKLTMRTIVGGEVKALLGDKESVDFAKVYGWATGEIKGERPTAFGDNIWLAGNFKAVNLLNGNVFSAPKLYAPELMHNMISEALKLEPDPKIQFGFIVGIKKSKAVIGYEYCIRTIMPAKEENNPFAAIEHQMDNNNPDQLTDPSKMTM